MAQQTTIEDMGNTVAGSVSKTIVLPAEPKVIIDHFFWSIYRYVELQGEETKETLILNLKAKEEDLHVTWAEGTIDNEHSGQWISNCCCIYHKPRRWDESDSDESDDECQTSNCRGHTQLRKKPAPGGANTKT